MINEPIVEELVSQEDIEYHVTQKPYLEEFEIKDFNEKWKICPKCNFLNILSIWQVTCSNSNCSGVLNELTSDEVYQIKLDSWKKEQSKLMQLFNDIEDIDINEDIEEDYIRDIEEEDIIDELIKKT